MSISRFVHLIDPGRCLNTESFKDFSHGLHVFLPRLETIVQEMFFSKKENKYKQKK